MGHVDDREVAELERRSPSGVTSAQVIAFFRERGVRLSEATFRRYVQLDLLPRCRRVGRQGRHRGSEGLYPVGVVRRLNEVKRLLDDGFAIESVRAMFRVSEDDIETVRARVERVAAAAEEQQRAERDEMLGRQIEELRSLGNRIEALMRAIGGRFARRGLRGRMAV